MEGFFQWCVLKDAVLCVIQGKRPGEDMEIFGFFEDTEPNLKASILHRRIGCTLVPEVFFRREETRKKRREKEAAREDLW